MWRHAVPPAIFRRRTRHRIVSLLASDGFNLSLSILAFSSCHSLSVYGVRSLLGAAGCAVPATLLARRKPLRIPTCSRITLAFATSSTITVVNSICSCSSQLHHHFLLDHISLHCANRGLLSSLSLCVRVSTWHALFAIINPLLHGRGFGFKSPST